MPQPSRAVRRQQGRTSGPTATPPHRDPMMPVYLGAAIVIVAIIVIFLGLRWQQGRAQQAAMATPSPGPNASAKPVILVDGGSLGAKHFREGNTLAGGTGQAVDGITCLAQEGVTLHIHSHVALFDHGKQLQIPRFIGFAPNAQAAGSGCLYWIHTHDASGIIHVEAPELKPPGGGPYTLGMLFDVWGQPLAANGVAGLNGPVTAFVNGSKYDGDLRSIPLMSHQQITLEAGTPVVPPPNYAFPPND